MCENLVQMAEAESTNDEALTEMVGLAVTISKNHCTAINAAPKGLVPVDKEVPHKDLRQMSSWEPYAVASSVMTDKQRVSGWKFDQVTEWSPKQKLSFIRRLCLTIHDRAIKLMP